MTTLQAHVDAIVTGAGLNLAMQTFTGGEVSREVARTRDPGARFSRSVPGPGDIGNVTVGVDYDESTHGPIMPTLRQSARDDTVFAVGHIRRDSTGNRSGMTTYTARLVRVTPPAGDTNGGATKATLELEFACDNISG
jgi:hypothetical protein